MEDSDWTPAELHCRHLLVCRTIWYDPNRPDDGFSLGKLLVKLLAESADAFPLRSSRLFVFAQLFGTPGEYNLTIRLVRIDAMGYGEEVETQLGPDEGPLQFELHKPFVVSGFLLVDAFAMPIQDIPFPTPGLYEFQLLRDDDEEPLARERLEVGS